MERAPSRSVIGMGVPIAEAARRSGLSTDTIRYYERSELADPPARDSAGRRSYSDSDIDWLIFLTRLRTTGMPIRTVREYAVLRRAGITTAAGRQAILVEQRRAVAKQIADLLTCQEILDYKIENYDRICQRQENDLLEEKSA